jgi:mitochondrial fission protein ELM1
MPEVLDGEAAGQLAERLLMHQAQRRKRLVVLTSPRTPQEVVSRLQDSLSQPAFSVLPWQAGQESPYAAALAIAAEFIVTSDSVSMLVECMLTAKPCFAYVLPQRVGPFQRLVESLGRRNRMPWLFETGLIETCANKSQFVSELVARNHIRLLGDPWPANAVPAQPTVTEAVRLIVDLANTAD